MSRFLFAGEGRTDFKVVKNLLVGFFKDKNLFFNRLLPKDKEPVGWGNVLKYLATDEFKGAFDNTDYIVIQIDTDRCEDGKHYENFSQDMKNHNTLMRKYSSNESLKIFIDSLKTAFPPTSATNLETEESE